MIDLAYRQTYKLPRGYEIEFKLDGPMLECAWSPDIPKGKRAKQLLPAYRLARERFIRSIGVPTMVVEI